MIPDWASDFLHTAIRPDAPSGPDGFTTVEGVSVRLLGVGIVEFLPDDPIASVVVSAAVHGNETAPAEMLDKIVADLAAGTLDLRVRLLAIVGNPPAVAIGKRFVEENLNRLFRGVHRSSTTDEGRRADELERAVASFFDAGDDSLRRLHYELHTAIRASELERFVILPFGFDLADDQLDFLRRSDVHAVLESNLPAPTFSFYAAESCRAESMTIELGRVSPLGATDPARLRAIDGALRAVLADAPPPPFVSEPIRFRVEHELMRTSATDYELHLAPDAPNFTLIEPGHRLISDPDGGLVVDEPGRRIVFPNADVPVGHRVALLVVPTP